MRDCAPPMRAVTRVNALLGGDRIAVVLEFEFLSGKMAGAQQ
jgi:hypothetical protein